MSERQFFDCGFETKDIDIDHRERKVEDILQPHWQDGDILLAHADDGVIWGEVREGRLEISHQVASEISPPLLFKTLQDLRLFNADREIRIWRTQDTFKGIIIRDTDPTDKTPKAFDEPHLLWGTKAYKRDKDFFLLEDGQQGLRHVIPKIKGITDQQKLLENRLYLQVRHYIEEDTSNGVNRIAISRLVKLGVTNGTS